VLTTKSWLLSDSCGFVDVGRSLWQENGSVVCNCYWFSPAQSISGSSRLGLATIFYCLRFETSLFVAFYDSQGYGGGIRPRLHTGRPLLLLLLLLLYSCLAYRIGDTESNSSATRCHENESLLCRKRLSTLLWGKCLSSRCSTTDCYSWSSRIRVSTSRYLCNGFTCHNIISIFRVTWRRIEYISPKRWYSPTRHHVVTARRASLMVTKL
jgi:hypothetical protein